MNGMKIVFFIVIIILIYFILGYLLQGKTNLSNSILSGQEMKTILASSLANSTSLNASNFSYSIWFNIDDWNYQYGQYKVLFGRQGATSAAAAATASSSSGSGLPIKLTGVDPCPVVVFDSIENDIIISLGCFPNLDHGTGNTIQVSNCRVSNVPIQEWVNLLISVYGRTLDVYINGKLVKTQLLPGIASVDQNAPIYLTPLGGFAGWTSRFQYWPNPVNPQFAWDIYEKGYSKNSIFGGLSNYQMQFQFLNNGKVQNTLTV